MEKKIYVENIIFAFFSFLQKFFTKIRYFLIKQKKIIKFEIKILLTFCYLFVAWKFNLWNAIDIVNLYNSKSTSLREEGLEISARSISEVPFSRTITTYTIHV